MKKFKILCLLTPAIVGILGLLISFLLYGDTPPSYRYYDEDGTEMFTGASFREMLNYYWIPVFCLFTCYLNLTKTVRDSAWWSFFSFFWPLFIIVLFPPFLFIFLALRFYVFYLVLFGYYLFFRIKGLSWISEEKELGESLK